MHAYLDALLTALYVRVDDLLPRRQGPGRPPRISDAELIALAVAQMFLGIPNDRKFLAFARWRLGRGAASRQRHVRRRSASRSSSRPWVA